jgi:hypothetical protein
MAELDSIDVAKHRLFELSQLYNINKDLVLEIFDKEDFEFIDTVCTLFGLDDYTHIFVLRALSKNEILNIFIDEKIPDFKYLNLELDNTNIKIFKLFLNKIEKYINDLIELDRKVVSFEDKDYGIKYKEMMLSSAFDRLMEGLKS